MARKKAQPTVVKSSMAKRVLVDLITAAILLPLAALAVRAVLQQHGIIVPIPHF